MNHLRSVQTRNVVVSNVMMSNAPKMTCPGDPHAQKHKQVSEYLRHALAKVHWEGGGKLPTGEDLIIRRSTHAQQKNRQHT